MIIKLDREYEVKCTLGTIRDIEVAFKKPFVSLLENVATLTTSEQIRLLYAGVKRADKTVEEGEFRAACEDKLGLADLAEYLQQFALEIQYPSLPPEEAKEKLAKKLSAARTSSTGAAL